jgi:hypothetical protein
MEGVSPDAGGVGGSSSVIDNEKILLGAFLKMQILNNKYRREIKKAYDIRSDEYNDELLNNRIYGIVTDGINWNFLCYEHHYGKVDVKLIHYEKI